MNELLKLVAADDAEGLTAFFNVNAHDDDGNTALHVAAKHNSARTIAKLLRLGADLDAENSAGHSALRIAVTNNNVAAARTLLFMFAYTGLKEGRSDCDHGSLEPILFTAATLPTPDIFLHALEVGCNHAEVYDNKSVLHSAAASGSVYVFDAFVARGWAVDPNDRGTGHWSLLDCAASNARRSVFEWFVTRNIPLSLNDQCCAQTPLSIAVATNNVEFVRYLIALGASVEARGLNVNRPLTESFHRKAFDVARFLIDFGANVHGHCRSGTALCAAVKNCDDKHYDLIDLLLDKGALPVHPELPDDEVVGCIHDALLASVEANISLRLIEKIFVRANRSTRMRSIDRAIKRRKMAVLNVFIRNDASIRNLIVDRLFGSRYGASSTLTLLHLAARDEASRLFQLILWNMRVDLADIWKVIKNLGNRKETVRRYLWRQRVVELYRSVLLVFRSSDRQPIHSLEPFITSVAIFSDGL